MRIRLSLRGMTRSLPTGGLFRVSQASGANPATGSENASAGTRPKRPAFLASRRLGFSWTGSLLAL